ncbi:hypothetical protein ACWHLZ_32335 [Streptomyces chartreusis]
MTTERHVEQFLLYALAKSGGSLNESLNAGSILASIEHDEQQSNVGIYIDTRASNEIVSLLVGRGYASSEERADGFSYRFKLTANGLDHARELLRRSRSKIERDTYLHNVLVRWAYERVPAGGSASLQGFAGDEHWWFAGTEVTWDEVFAAVHFLEAEGLLRVEDANGFARVQPTPLGIKFAHSKQTLRTFTTTQSGQGSGVTNNFFDSNVVQGDAPGSNFATG